MTKSETERRAIAEAIKAVDTANKRFRAMPEMSLDDEARELSRIFKLEERIWRMPVANKADAIALLDYCRRPANDGLVVMPKLLGRVAAYLKVA